MNSKREFLEAHLRAVQDPEMQRYLVKWTVPFKRALSRLGVDKLESLGTTDAERIGEFWQDFWEALPEDSSIRTAPFFTVCDLAEWFCFGDR